MGLKLKNLQFLKCVLFFAKKCTNKNVPYLPCKNVYFFCKFFSKIKKVKKIFVKCLFFFLDKCAVSTVKKS